MKAVYLTDIETFEVRDIPRPRLTSPADVLLRVETVGVCGSDIHYFRDGRIGSMVVQFPWIIGHEFAAVVEEVGSAVTTLRPGQRVAVDPLVACGVCDQCRGGRVHTCRNQSFLGCPGQLPGAMVEMIVMPAACCLPVPAGMSADQATLVEPYSVAMHARHLARLKGNERIAVLGCGPIGLCVLAALRDAGVEGVRATDLHDNRLELARRFGAAWTGNASRAETANRLRDQQPLGYNVIFECAGKPETIDQAAELLAPGGTLVLVGIPADSRISLDMNELRRKELAVQCVRRQNECVVGAIDAIASGRVNLDALVTHHVTPEQSQQAYELAADYRDGVVKAMICF